MTALGDFTSQADSYGRARPGYPAELVDSLVKHLGLVPGDPVVDLGAGTGLFTQLLAARRFSVTAVEPNEAMRSQAPPMLGVVWLAGTFEATGLPASSQRWAVAAQAFHWADPARALPEIRRILQPNGSLTVLWNNRQNERSDILAWTREAIRRHVPDFEESYRAKADWPRILTQTGDFAGVVCHESEHVVTMPRERYLELWRSHNRLATTAGVARLQAFRDDLRAYLLQRNVPTVNVPYLTKAWTVRRT
jgi:ubiquinone/menaquinone biosynthesis C-methylase UbiE